MSELVVIVNPAAGKGRGLEWIRSNEDTLKAAFRSVSTIITSEPGEARRIAASLPPETRLVAAVGGDGTLNEVVNGMDRNRQTLAVIPAGSGNDLIKSLDIPSNLSAAASLMEKGTVQSIDCGRVNNRLFVNSLAMGIDGAVAEFMNNNRWLPTRIAYHMGVVTNVFSFRNRHFRWASETARGEVTANMLAVMNGHTYGGGYTMAPNAVINDGKLNLVIVGDYGIAGRIRHLPKVKTGTHLDLDKVTWLEIEQLRISCDNLPPVAVDGELLQLSADTRELEIAVETAALKIIAPPSSSSASH